MKANPERIIPIRDDAFAAKKTEQIPSGLNQSATTHLRHETEEQIPSGSKIRDDAFA